MVPVLTAIFIYQGIPTDKVVHLALGTSMASMILTSVSSLRAHHARDGVLWNIVKQMAAGILMGAFLATFLASSLSSLYLAIFFSLFMAYVSLQMFMDKKAVKKNGRGDNAVHGRNGYRFCFGVGVDWRRFTNRSLSCQPSSRYKEGNWHLGRHWFYLSPLRGHWAI